MQRSLSEEPTKSIPMLLISSKDSKALELKPNGFEITKHFPNIQSSIIALKKTEDSNKLSRKISNGVTTWATFNAITRTICCNNMVPSWLVSGINILLREIKLKQCSFSTNQMCTTFNADKGTLLAREKIGSLGQ